MNTCSSRKELGFVALSLVDIAIEVNSLIFSVVADDLVLANATHTCTHNTCAHTHVYIHTQNYTHT